MEKRLNARAGKLEIRGNPPTSGNIRHDSHKRKYETDLTGNRTGLVYTASEKVHSPGSELMRHISTASRSRPTHTMGGAKVEQMKTVRRRRGRCTSDYSRITDAYYRSNLILVGATVAERIARSPPTKANRDQYPAGSPDFHKWESCRTMPLIGRLSRGSPASPVPSFRRRSICTSFTLIGSQDLAVKSRPTFFTLHSQILVDKRILSSAGMKGREQREIPEKTRRPAASSGTIPKSENPGVTRPGLNPAAGQPFQKTHFVVVRSWVNCVLTGSQCDKRNENLPCRRHRGRKPATLRLQVGHPTPELRGEGSI
ncbi:hypothetical protein PR048_027264 [Dryococelus australis]|uniref:Uncharacterized protein n=1 Tax=Dryococelus australis TaxID=614101 RepID=A0ABQ9GFF8_9NEOP|nr:hypothetical protein PR048_027264 [Dryococelus australis]